MNLEHSQPSRDPQTGKTGEELATVLPEYGLQFSPPQIEQLDDYRRRLWAWNEQINLTRHTTLDKFVGRDVVDSWQLAQQLAPGERILDVGTGGGVPGLILAILRPDLQVSVCESTQKKSKVVQQIVAGMQLPVRVYSCRAEEVLELQTFDTLIARAVASMTKILTWLAPHWEAFDRLLLVKGKRWVEERGEARHRGQLKEFELRKLTSYTIPGTEAESVFLQVNPSEQEW